MVRAPHRHPWKAWGLAAVLVVQGAFIEGSAADDGPVVAAAASLRFVMPELSGGFTKDTGRRVRISIGASGNLTRQALQGAPFQVFLAADDSYPRRLAEAGQADRAPVVYARGRLALFRAGGMAVSIEAFRQPANARIAIANPAHAPYGRAARETLRHLNLWPLATGRLVLGENAAQAAQFAFSGNVDWALLPRSLVVDPKTTRRGRWTLVPQGHHAPLDHAMVLLKGAGATARAFFRFMQDPEAGAVLAKYGFEAPRNSE